MAVRVSKTDFEEKVLKEKLPVLVDFYSDSCVACKKLAPVLGNAEDDYEDKIKVYKVNTNFDVELAEQYEVQANPTLILFKDGQDYSKKRAGIKEKNMFITVAGEKKEVKDGLTLPELIAQENVEMPEYVTVSINEEFVASEDKESTVLKEGDNVEFLYFMGGGC